MAFTIEAEFRRIDQISLYDVHRECGVYSIWTKQARVGPTYLGEGNVLTRFVDHMRKKDWARNHLDGSIALVRRGTDRERKWKAETIEAALLEVAGRIGRQPLHNRHPGKRAPLEKLMRRRPTKTGQVCIVVRGFDPLVPPERGPLSAPKEIFIYFDDDGEWEIEHPHWRQRQPSY